VLLVVGRAAYRQPPISVGVKTSEIQRVTFVVPRDLHERLVDSARSAEGTVSAELRVALREHLALIARRGPAPDFETETKRMRRSNDA
jgi:hypothetical protein